MAKKRKRRRRKKTEASILKAEVWSDGSYGPLKNCEMGGAAAIVRVQEPSKKLYTYEVSKGFDTAKDNADMELKAILLGLEELHKKCDDRKCSVTIFTDSQQIIAWVTQENWVKGDRKDDWQELSKLIENHEVTWCWVGSRSRKHNKRADKLAAAVRLETQKKVGCTCKMQYDKNEPLCPVHGLEKKK